MTGTNFKDTHDDVDDGSDDDIRDNVTFSFVCPVSEAEKQRTEHEFRKQKERIVPQGVLIYP